MKKPYVPSFDGKGHCKLSSRYKEILKLYDMLADAHIPFTLRRNFDGWQILYPAVLNFPEEEAKEQVKYSVIEHFGSYGNEQDLLEIMDMTGGGHEPVGWFTAEEVYEHIKKHWEQSKL